MLNFVEKKKKKGRESTQKKLNIATWREEIYIDY